MNVFIAAISLAVVLGLAFCFVLAVTEVGRALGRRIGGRPIDPAPSAPPNPAPPPDAAAQELRMRYARGEISREEYLQRKIDLEEF
ncbi:putative membrane protein [Nocardiopsis sp. Huas11]|uniref:SHOCT domain-containing protein n=1 Tax=Nocardiopsis sp. Huas11 TaxID=2183912 RepID=UPI000EAD5C4D|nr:SHOCT domain-containing protein [Nocardiopsis sp. Huas11]RKS08791.1 putative membrane protein [Nocardiopsis sp. Huas11]